VAITPVSRIPLAARAGLTNPVASDTESRVPLPPPGKQAARGADDDADAIAIRSRRAPTRRSEAAARALRYRNPGQDRPNQVYAGAGQALGSPMYGATSGSGNIGLGPANPFGNRYGFYVELLRQKVGQHWRTGDVDPRLRTAPAIIVVFEILRNGSIRNVQVLQRSGNYALDMSAQRAIMEAAPFDALPAGFDRDSARIEFWFELKR
jgi:protein TonB